MFDRGLLICDVCKAVLIRPLSRQVSPNRVTATTTRQYAKRQGWKRVENFKRKRQKVFDVCPKCDPKELGFE